jgi:terpene synthase-like protein
MSSDPEVFERHRELFARALPTPWLHQEPAPQLAAWISETLAASSLFPAEEAQRKRLPQLMIFVSHCAPPGASSEGLRLACEFLFAFFLFNDDWSAHGAGFFDRAPTPSLSPGALYVRGWLRAFEARFGARSARFIAAFEQYWQSLCFEQTLKARAEPPTFDEYVDRQRGRYQWVATAPYIELWEVAQGIALDEHERPRADALKELGVELSYLANDIGSLRRDQGCGNYVKLRSASTDLSEQLRQTSADYDARVQRYLELASGAQGELLRYVSLVSAITDGNLKATTLLALSGDAGRYAPEARDCLQRLRTLGAP